MDNKSPGNDAFIDQSQREFFNRLLPLILTMAIVFVFGLLGNIFAFIFYTFRAKRTTHSVQIAYLSIVDLLVCVMIIPKIVEMAMNVKYDQPFLCKLSHFFSLWTIGSSVFILWLIALDRHRKICKPLAKQLNVKNTTRAIIGLIVVTFLLSVKNFAIYDTLEINVTVFGSNRTVLGRCCTTRSDGGYKISVSILHTVDFLICLMILITVIVTYTHVLLTLFKKRRTITIDKATEKRERTPVEVMDNHEADTRNAVERNITYMMLTVSLLFVLCFFPYFVIKLVMRIAFKTNKEFEMDVGAQFALRLVYLNSVFNPFVYCFFNPKFRLYLRDVLFRCFRYEKESTNTDDILPGVIMKTEYTVT